MRQKPEGNVAPKFCDARELWLSVRTLPFPVKRGCHGYPCIYLRFGLPSYIHRLAVRRHSPSERAAPAPEPKPIEVIRTGGLETASTELGLAENLGARDGLMEQVEGMAGSQSS